MNRKNKLSKFPLVPMKICAIVAASLHYAHGERRVANLPLFPLFSNAVITPDFPSGMAVEVEGDEL